MPHVRLTFFIVFLGCASLILAALYMQHALEMAPCALCITQRIFVIGVGIVSLIACIHNPLPMARRIYSVIGLILAGIGGFFSYSHLALQHLPEDEVPACAGFSLDYLIESFPFAQALELLLKGDGECAKVSFEFLTLSIPAWTLIAFVGLALIMIWQFLRKTPHTNT